ncbi:MAG TPA: DUF3667 domain-containing protein [Lacunisphaera sp.]|nr:DUF3667 domain-containing protein [Lacunisphaera sp.]
MCSHPRVALDPHPPDIPGDPVTGAATAAAIAAVPHRGHGPIHSHCENCGEALRGPFCHRCGQHDFDYHRSFGHMLLDALENFFHFDEKLFRNIVTLLFRPGELTAAFNAGKRAAQMPPLRFYIFVSVLFFFVSFIGSRPASPEDPGVPGSPAQREMVRTMLDNSLRDVRRGTADPRARARAERVIRHLREDLYNPTAPPLDSRGVDQAIADGIRRQEAAEKAGKAAEPAMAEKKILRTHLPGGLNLSVEEKQGTALERFLTEKGRFAIEHEFELIEAFIHAIPKMLLFCLPLFALFTRLLFRRSGQAYLQHLVVALHFHTFIFLWVLARNGWTDLAFLASHALGSVVRFGCNLWLLVYPFRMFRRLFGNSWLWTIVKTGVTGTLYTVTLGLGFLLTGLVLVLLL